MLIFHMKTEIKRLGKDHQVREGFKNPSNGLRDYVNRVFKASPYLSERPNDDGRLHPTCIVKTYSHTDLVIFVF